MSWKRKLELQFTENCVLREFSGLKVDNQDVYTLPHESKETALIFQKVLYHAIVPDLQKNRDVTCGARWRGESMVLAERPIQSRVDFRRCNIKEERGGDLGDERTPRSGEPHKKDPQQTMWLNKNTVAGSFVITATLKRTENISHAKNLKSKEISYKS